MVGAGPGGDISFILMNFDRLQGLKFRQEFLGQFFQWLSSGSFQVSAIVKISNSGKLVFLKTFSCIITLIIADDLVFVYKSWTNLRFSVFYNQFIFWLAKYTCIQWGEGIIFP
jgi:hypothetical protein